MGKMMAQDGKTRVLQPVGQFTVTEDAHMTAVGERIRPAKFPAELFGKLARNAHSQIAPGPGHAGQFGQGPVRVVKMFEHFRADDQIKRMIWKRKIQGIGGGQGPLAAGQGAPAFVLGKTVGRGQQIGMAGVCPDHRYIATGTDLTGMAAAAAADIQNAPPWADG